MTLHDIMIRELFFICISDMITIRIRSKTRIKEAVLTGKEFRDKMSFQMTHMQIAYNLIDKLLINEGKEEFILGSVAPDSVHFRENYCIEEKIHTHLFEGCGPWSDTRDYDRWLYNIGFFWDKFGKDEPDIRRRMFVLGICVHCHTDYYNDRLIWRDLQDKNIPPMTLEEFREAYYPEARSVDKWLYQNSPDQKQITELLYNSWEYQIDGYIYPDDLKRLKHHLINVQYNIKEKIDVTDFKFYTSGKILWFAETVTKRIASVIHL
ncbi:MAG: hypothetical protein K6B28_09205 [Lachnospiraceae bacterium]|nr:hypothetical protein [Lachnospiraceae bacterium]